MRVPCSYKKCGNRRKHWMLPFKRGKQYVNVPDDFHGKAYCSMECALLDGAMSVKGTSE